MEIVKHPNKWLQKQLPLFDFEKLDVEAISKSMIETMLASDGLGLSANQVKVDGQIMTMKPMHLESKEPIVLINPEIIDVSKDTKESIEGCLSFPELFLKIKRPLSVTVKYVDIHQKDCIINLYGIDARCFLHEFDHLNGITFTDRVSKLKLDIAKKKRDKKRKLVDG